MKGELSSGESSPVLRPNVPMKKILVVDDDEGMRGVAAAALYGLDYEVIQAQDGTEGLEMAKHHLPDLILCDVSMPKMDGYQFLAALKQIPEISRIPFIFLTGKSLKEEVRNGMRLGADDYLTKPFTVDELVAAVKTRLSKSEAWHKYVDDKLEQLRASIGLSMPHEIRTPLTGILGFSEILKADDELSRVEVVELGEMIHRSASRLHHLLENMLLNTELDSIESDHTRLNALRQHTTPSLRLVIQDVARDKAAKANRPDDLRFELQDTKIRISEQYLRKLIEELIDNALKFSQEGSSITISNTIEEHQVKIAISDSGRGMSLEEVNNIGAYLQFDRKRHEQQGSGLGLAISKKLVKLHGGSFSIGSDQGKGSTFWFTLPK
jgi:two-component system sensor histidine kinase/response regulator